MVQSSLSHSLPQSTCSHFKLFSGGPRPRPWPRACTAIWQCHQTLAICSEIHSLGLIPCWWGLGTTQLRNLYLCTSCTLTLPYTHVRPRLCHSPALNDWWNDRFTFSCSNQTFRPTVTPKVGTFDFFVFSSYNFFLFFFQMFHFSRTNCMLFPYISNWRCRTYRNVYIIIPILQNFNIPCGSCARHFVHQKCLASYGTYNILVLNTLLGNKHSVLLSLMMKYPFPQQSQLWTKNLPTVAKTAIYIYNYIYDF